VPFRDAAWATVVAQRFVRFSLFFVDENRAFYSCPYLFEFAPLQRKSAVRITLMRPGNVGSTAGGYFYENVSPLRQERAVSVTANWVANQVPFP